MRMFTALLRIPMASRENGLRNTVYYKVEAKSKEHALQKTEAMIDSLTHNINYIVLAIEEDDE